LLKSAETGRIFAESPGLKAEMKLRALVVRVKMPLLSLIFPFGSKKIFYFEPANELTANYY